MVIISVSYPPSYYDNFSDPHLKANTLDIGETERNSQGIKGTEEGLCPYLKSKWNCHSCFSKITKYIVKIILK